MENPPVEEKQDEANDQCYANVLPSNLFLLHAFRTHTRQGKKKDGKQFCVERGMKQPCGTVEVHHDTVNHTDVQVPLHDTGIAIPIDVHYYENNTHGTEKIHDFRQCPQIIFLLHNRLVKVSGHDSFSSCAVTCDGMPLPLHQ